MLEDFTSTELSGWIEYERMDEEVRANWLAYAITKAFRVERKSSGTDDDDDDDEEVIDTTKPEFAQQFKGFINVPQGKPLQQRGFHDRNTEIRQG